MINVNDEIKQAYDKSTTQIDKILVNGNEYRISNVENYDDVYNEGNIFGTAISRCLEFEIQNTIDLEKTEIEYFTGILINTTIQWISLGKFIIQSVEPNDTTQINKVTAMDYMIKSNTIYTSNLDYSSGKITLLRVLQEACDNSNLELATFDFANKDFIVDSNQFDEGTLNRQVIQAIAQLSGTVAKIRTDNKLYLINPNNDLEVSKIFNLNNYKEAEIKRNTHPINVVSLGMADVEGENITLKDEASIETLGEENTIVFNDNPFAYTQQKREQLITALFNAIKGFEYKAFSFKCQGLPYLETLDKIQFKDKKGNTYNSYIFRFNYKSPNGLESSIEAPSITKATVNYQNVPSALDIAKRTELKVDKANQTITFIVEEQTTQSNRISDVEKETNTVASNLNTFLTTTYVNDIDNIQKQIDGAIQFWNGSAIPTLNNYPANEWKTEQERINHQADIYTVIQDVAGEMKQGKSYRFDKVGTTWQWVELTDNELSAVQALANSKAKVYVVQPTPPYNIGDLWLKDNELYECSSAKDSSGTFSASDWKKATKYTDDTVANEALNKANTNTTEIKKTNTALSEITQTTESIKSRVETTENTVETINGELKLTDNVNGYPIHIENAGVYKAINYTVSGNSEQKTRSGKNKLGILPFNNFSSNGVTISFDGETFTITGIPTLRWYSLVDKVNIDIPVGRYLFSYVNSTQTRIVLSLNFDDETNQRYWLINKSMVIEITKPVKSFSLFTDGQTSGVEINKSITGLMLEPMETGSTPTEYEQYGVSPSPKFPSSIKTVGIKSFIKDSDIHTSNNSLYYLGKNYLYSNNDLKECIELEANTTYTFSCKTYTNDNKLTLMDSSKTALTRVTLTGVYTFTTTQKCWLHYYSNGNTEQPKWQLINCGTQIDDLSYGNWLISKIIGKNLLKLDEKLVAGYTYTNQGIVYTFNQNGSISIKGTTGTRLSSMVLLGENLNNYTTKRWHEDKDIVVNFSVAGLALNCRLTNGTYSSLANAKGKDVGVICLQINPNTTIDTTIYPFVTYKTDSNFEAYKENIVKLNLQDNELVKIDDVYDEVNMTTGILTKRIGKVVLDGSDDENWKGYSADNDYFFYIDNVLKTTDEYVDGLCSHFKCSKVYPTEEGYFSFRTRGTSVYFRINGINTVNDWKTWLSSNPVTVYYVLVTPEIIQFKDLESINLLDGENNVNVTSNINPFKMTINYYTQSAINNTYQTQFAQQEITNNSIEQRVSASEENTASLEKKYTSLSETVEGFDFNVVKDIQEKIENGNIKSNIVETTTVRIDADGLHTKKSGSQMQSLLDNEGMYVNNGDIDKTSTKNNTLTVDKDGVVTENLYVRTYATLGYHRTEGFSENGELRTGVFYQGGEV